MKEGYIVWNETNYGDGYEFFGVFRTRKQAEKAMRKVAKARLGRCPRDYDKMLEALEGEEDMGDSYKITYFSRNDGENEW